MYAGAAQPAARPHLYHGAGELPRHGLRVLFLVSAHNSLSQRVKIALTELGHEVTVAVVDSAGAMESAVARHRPELIVCPMLKTIIPESIFARHRCLIVHPGPKGDRGPSSLDWAIELGAGEWGVTVLEATAAVDGGDVWATRTFPTRAAGKSSLYRHEVRRAAVDAVVQAVTQVAAGRRARRSRSTTATRGSSAGRGRCSRRPSGRSTGRPTPTATVLRRIHAAEGHPGVLDAIRRDPVPSVRRPRRTRAARPSRRAGRPSGTARCAERRSTGRSGSRT